MERIWDIRTNSNCCPVTPRDIFRAREHITSGEYRSRIYEGITVHELCIIDLIEDPAERDNLNPCNYQFAGWRVEMLCCSFDRTKTIDFIINQREVRLTP